MTPQEIFVSFKTAKFLRLAGFDWYAYNFYNKDGEMLTPNLIAMISDWNAKGKDTFSAPSLAVAQKWLREVKEMEIVIEPELCNNGADMRYHWYCGDREMYFAGGWTCEGYELEFEKAQESAIKQSLQIILNR